MDSSSKEPNSTRPEGTAEGHYESMRQRAARAWREVDKGPRRAILLAFVLSWVLWVPIAQAVWWGEAEGLAIVLFPFFYWVLVFGGLWVYRGFKK